jgi:hypothetical protein
MASALPAHLKGAVKSALGNGDAANAEFARKHHGKTQSHMVSRVWFLSMIRMHGGLQSS